MTQARGKAAERIRSAVGRDERSAAWGDYIGSVLGGALTKAAGRCGVGRTRLTDAVSGKTGFRISDVPALEEEHGVAILEMLAEVLGYRITKANHSGNVAAHVEVVVAGAAVIARVTAAAADGRFERKESTEARAAISRMRNAIDAIDQQFAEAEVVGVRLVGGAS